MRLTYTTVRGLGKDRHLVVDTRLQFRRAWLGGVAEHGLLCPSLPYCVAQVGPELRVKPLSQPPKCQDYRCQHYSLIPVKCSGAHSSNKSH